LTMPNHTSKTLVDQGFGQIPKRGFSLMNTRF
jgi:hypothetical protein